MKIEIIKDKLLAAITQAERIAGKHISLPILSCVIIEAREGVVSVKATNLDVGIEISVVAKIFEDGVVALQGSLLKSFVSSLGNNKSVLFEVKEGACIISSGSSEASFRITSPDDFPVIPRVSGDNPLVIPSKDFVLGLRSVVWSAAVSSIKPELSSVYIYEDDSFLVFVATDSFRLAEKRVKTKNIKNLEPLLIPFKNSLEIVRVFEDFDGDLKIFVSKNQLSILTENIHLSSRVVDGNFPDYRQIIPKEYETEANILKSDFVSAIKISGIFANNFNQLLLSFDTANKKIDLLAKNNDIGEGKQSLKAVLKGKDVSMSFNHKFILDCLHIIEDENIVLKMAGVGKPMIIAPAHNPSFVYLVMSMNK